MTSFGVRGGGCRSHDKLDDSEGGVLLSIDRRVLNAVGFKLTGEVSVQSGVGLFTGEGSWVREAIQEVVHCNRLPRLRNRLFPKSAQTSFGVVIMSDPVSIYLKDFELREGWILESRVHRQGGTEVVPLPIQPLLSRILSSS